MKTTLLNILKIILRSLAKATLWRYKPIVVGITGNVGKTSTKEAVNIVLGHEKKIRTSSKSFNNELGFPLAILGNWRETGGVIFWIRVIIASVIRLVFKVGSYPEILVLEYGVDRPGDMQYLLDIARPQIGVVTAIGEIPVHIEFFAGKDSVAREKAKLVNCLPATGFALLNADDVTVYEMKDQTRARVVTYGFSENADMRITSFETTFSPLSEKSSKSAGLTFKLNYGGSFIPIRLNNVLGKAQAYSAAAASALGLTFGINLVSISEALGSYISPPGRLRVIPGIKNTTIIDDSYNASPLAVEEALRALGSIKTKRKIAVLGDMLEIGQYTMEAHESIGKLAAKTADLLITLGIRAKFIAEGANKAGMPKKDIFIFENVKEVGIFLQGTLKKGDVALVKGSQGVRMEEIVKEVMLEPEKAGELLVRQDKRWLARKGMY